MCDGCSFVLLKNVSHHNEAVQTRVYNFMYNHTLTLAMLLELKCELGGVLFCTQLKQGGNEGSK